MKEMLSDTLEALLSMGLAASARGDHELAIGCLERALVKAPDSSINFDHFGTALVNAGRHAEALVAYDRAILLNPRFHAAHNNRGVFLENQGYLTEAIAAYARALEIRPDVAEIHANMGNALKELCEFDQAISHYRRALELSPGFSRVHSALLFCLNYHPEITPARLFQEYEAWEARHATPLRRDGVSHANDRDPGRRIRVGYVSPDFCEHSVRHYIEPVLAAHDPRTVEVFCYADVVAPDVVTGRLRRYAAQWVNAVGMSDQDLAARIREDRIDVLVDLAGHTARNRMLVFARKPAPVQITWLGFATTTGLRAMDYFLATETMVPAGCERYFSEAVYRLPHTLWCYLPPAEIPDAGPPPVLRDRRVTYGCFSRTIRLNHRVVKIWSRILAAVPDAQLILNYKTFLDPAARSLFASRFAHHGIDPDRVRMIFTTPQSATWEAYKGIDIALDPFPHNAGATTIEALWMGVPVVTLAERPPLGRIGAMALGQLGMDDWVAETEEEYVGIAVSESRDPERLGRLRENLRRRFAASSLCDAETFTMELESSYRQMWQRWCTQVGNSGLEHPKAATAIQQSLQIALEHHNAGNLAEAERIYREILSLDPRHADALHLLGVIAFHAGRTDAACDLIQRAIALNPSVPEYHSNLGNVLKEIGSTEDAIASYRCALALRPGFADAQYNLGNAYAKDERLDQALECYQASLQLRPVYPPGWVNIGNALRSLGRIPEALDYYDRVPSTAAEFSETRWNRAIALLLSGDLARGWQEYECRWNLERAKPRRRNFAQPAWDGENISSRTILLHAEQGFGDTLQFIRYAPLVAAGGARVVVECQPELAKLIRGMDGIGSVLSTGEKLPDFDLHLPLLSLPRIFRTTLDTIPASVPYLHLDSARARRWARMLASGRKKRFKVGLAWAGGTSDPKRDCSLAALGPLAAAFNTVFVSLQKGEAAAQAANPPPGMELLDMATELHDFTDTATLISRLDLVISVDTSVAHLAGALGKPVWTLLRFAPDWRWLLGRADSPWYPTMRLFRQSEPGVWRVAIATVARELSILAQQRRT